MAMKVCIVLGNYYKYGMGGSEIQAKFLADYLLKHDSTVSYVFHGRENSLSPIEDKGNFKLFQVKKPFRGKRPLNYLNKGFIMRLMDKISPDLVYYRGNLDFSDVISGYTSRNGIPLVYGLASDVQSKRRKIRRNGMFLVDALNKYLGERFYDRVDRFICQSEYQKSQLKENFGYDSIVIRNGHPIPDKLEEKDDPPRIIWIGNIKGIKQPMLFVELAERFLGKSAVFTMIGRSDDDNLLDRVVERIDGVDNIEYLGELGFEEANEMLGRSSVLINTSKFEGFSNTFIQAWLRKTPVLSLNSDPDSIMEANRIGHRSGDMDRMYKQLSALLSDPGELREMGNRARKYAVKNHVFEKIGASYLDLFRELTNKQ
ncbi:MAG: glycosyltransferase family 4 protein [Thermoplasmatota archaeon]